MRKYYYLFLIMILSNIAYGQTVVYDSVYHQLKWRTYKLHIPPSYNGNTPFPLVIALHGGGHTADTMEFITNFSSKADASNFLVVYPNGRKFLTQTWNAGTCCGSSVTFNVDDVGFIVKMINSLKANYNIDTTRIYLTGASNGGMMAYRLACERADLFAAVALVATTMVVTSPCIPSRPVPILHIHSMPDTHVPCYGGYGTGYAGVYMPPIDSVIGVWASNDTCTGTLDTIYHVGGAVGKKWMNCSSCSEVLIYTTTDGGHSWPGGNQTANGDPVSTQLNATDLIWNFFSQHSLNCSNTSISKSSLLENIKIYLNSAKNQIIIDIPEYISDFTVEILDLEGRFLLAKKNEKIISTNTLVNKTYILIFTSNRINFIKKLNKVD